MQTDCAMRLNECSADRSSATASVPPAIAGTAGESGRWGDLRVRVALFRAIKEDMRQVISQLVGLHGDEILCHKVMPADLAKSAQLRCVFEGIDDLPAEGLLPRQFAQALIERGYGRASVLSMVSTDDNSTTSDHRVPLPSQGEQIDLEEHCVSLLGTQVTLAEHGDCIVAAVCPGGHIKVVLQPSGRSTFVPISNFGPKAVPERPPAIDLEIMQPVRLPPAATPARSLDCTEVGEWLADECSVAWEFQAGTLWSKFDDDTSQALEASISSCALGSSLGGSLMSLTSMRSAYANAFHLVDDLPTFLQVPVHDDDLVNVLRLGCQVSCINEEEREVALELVSDLTARGWCVEVAANGTTPTAGDVCLELETRHDWPLTDARFGANAYALAIQKDAPLMIRAKTADGLRRGCAMLTRSIGHGVQHAGAEMQHISCNDGPLAEPVSSVPVSVPSRQAVLDQSDGASTSQLVAQLPSCFFMDCPIHTGYNRVWYGRTECWTLATFLENAAIAGAFQPSHSRRVRRRVNYSRSDHKMLQVCSSVTGESEAYNYATAIESDGVAVKVQFARKSETEEVPLSNLRVPVQLNTGLEWDTVISAQRSTSGKVGVLFLQFPGSRVVVAKLTDSPASELAGSELVGMLQIRTPKIGVLSTAHGEGATIVATLRRLRTKGLFEGKWESPHKFSFVLLQELQTGRTLKELCHEEAAVTPNSTWPIETFGPAGHPSQYGVNRLRALGALVASDVLSHNSDRFFLPGLFQNFSRCGNVANLMFDSDDDSEPIAIDNALCAYECTHADNSLRFQQYCDSVTELTSRVMTRVRDADNGRDPQLPAHPALKNVREFFVSGQGKSGDASYVPGLEHDIGQRGLIELERGFLSVIDQLQQWKSTIGIDAVFAGLMNHSRQALGLSDQSTAFDLQRLEPSFFVAIANAMLDAQPAIDCVQPIESVTSQDVSVADSTPEGWYVKRPALGVGKPFCKIGDRLAAQVETMGNGAAKRWHIGVVSSYDQTSDQATVTFTVPYQDRQCCEMDALLERRSKPTDLIVGLDDLPDVRWALATDEEVLPAESVFDVQAPPVLGATDDAVVSFDPDSCEDEISPIVGGSDEAKALEQAMPWHRFARASARLEDKLVNAIATSGRACKNY